MEEKISSSERGKSRIVDFAQRVVSSKTFDWIITGVILLQAFALAIEATPALLSMGKDIVLFEAETFRLVQSLVVSVFIVEAALRLIAVYPRPQTYFKEPWNCFDFAIIILSLMPISGQFSTIARLVRLLRITRLVTKSIELRYCVHANPLNTQYI